VTPPYRLRRDTAETIRQLIDAAAFEQRFATGFRLPPRRGVVQRTVAWFGKQRRLSTDDQFLSAMEAAWLYLTRSPLSLRRLAYSKS
jgi:transposase